MYSLLKLIGGVAPLLFRGKKIKNVGRQKKMKNLKASQVFQFMAECPQYTKFQFQKHNQDYLYNRLSVIVDSDYVGQISDLRKKYNIDICDMRAVGEEFIIDFQVQSNE